MKLIAITLNKHNSANIKNEIDRIKKIDFARKKRLSNKNVLSLHCLHYYYYRDNYYINLIYTFKNINKIVIAIEIVLLLMIITYDDVIINDITMTTFQISSNLLFLFHKV